MREHEEARINYNQRSRTSAIELNGALQLNDSGRIGPVDGIIELLEGLVVVADVTLVVHHHDLTADDGLQRFVALREFREREGLQVVHRHLSL